MRKFLQEVRLGALSLTESNKTMHPGCLGTISGPCADYKNPTRNGNFYSRKLWENVFNDDIVKECLKDRTLIGELDHPGDGRLETKATNACIVMTGYNFNDDEGLMYGTFDILDTPFGRVLKSLLDYGCKIGVSSRGEGDVTISEMNGNDVSVVDEDNFEFVTFDAVVVPAVKKAKPALQEGISREKVTSLVESLQKEVKSATTQSELNLIKSVVDATDLPDSDSLIESVNNKSKELIGSTRSGQLVEDLENAMSKINDLEGQIKSLKEELVTSKSNVSRQISSKKVVVNSLRKKEALYLDLNDKYKNLVFESSVSANKAEELASRLVSSLERIQELRDENRTTGLRCQELESKVTSLEESLGRSQEVARSKSDEVRELRSQVESLRKSSTKKIQESMSSSRSAQSKLESKLSRSNKLCEDYRMAYIKERCKSAGVSLDQVIKTINESTTVGDIEKLLETLTDRRDRYRGLTVTNDKLIENAANATVTFSDKSVKVNKSLANTHSFMEETLKYY